MKRFQYTKHVPQLEDDLHKFHVTSNLLNFTHTKKINIKLVIYRSITLFVSALGRSYGVKEHSSFRIIDELKRRNVLSKMASQRLSLAVAVACNIRLVHYSSKKRQEDDISKDDEFEGRGKFQELAKIVHPMWLIKSLETVSALQLLLSSDIHISNFDEVLVQNRSAILLIMTTLGLYEQCIVTGIFILEKETTLTAFDCLGLLLGMCISCAKLKLFHESLGIIHSLRSKLQKPPQAIEGTPEELEKINSFRKLNGEVEKMMKLTEAQILFRLEQCHLALIITEELLKTHLIPPMFVLISICNIRCNIAMCKGHEPLSSIRDLLKAHGSGELKQWFDGGLYVDVIRCIAYALIATRRKEQGLHWARQGLHFVREYGLTSFYVELFTNLIKYIVTNDVKNLANQFFLY